MEVQSLTNDYRSNLLIELFTLSQKFKHPVTVRYEDWVLVGDKGKIRIIYREELICRYTNQDTFIASKVTHKFKVPLQSIMKLGEIL